VKNIITTLALLILAIPAIGQNPPATFNHSMTFNGETININFEQFSTRSGSFQVLEQVAGGALSDVTSDYSHIRTYIGSVVEYPGAVACATYRDGGRAVQANVVFESGYQWFDQGGTVIDFSRLFPIFQLSDFEVVERVCNCIAQI